MDDQTVLEAFQVIRRARSPTTHLSRSPTTHVSPSPATTSPLFTCFDILYKIGGYLLPGDQYRFLQVSKATYGAMAPLLYRRVCINRLEDYAFIFPRELIPQTAIPSSGPVFIPPDVKPPPLLDVYTRCIEVPVYQGGMLPPLPNVRTAIFKPLGRKAYRASFGGERTVFRPPCNVWDMYLPNIIPADLPSRSKGNTVIQLNHHTRCMYKLTLAPFFGLPPPQYSPPSSQTCAILLLPFYWDYGFVSSPLPTFYDTRGRCQFIQNLIEVVTRFAILNPTRTFTLIGFEAANPYAPTRHWDNRAGRQATVAELLDECFEDIFKTIPALNTWLPHQKAEIRERINLVTFYDYLNTCDWKDDLDWRLVGRWLNAYDAREKAEAAAAAATEAAAKAVAKAAAKVAAATEAAAAAAAKAPAAAAAAIITKHNRKRKREPDDDESQNA